VRVADLMTTDIVTVDPNDKVVAADEAMQKRRVRHVPVVDDGELVGIVSHRDLSHNALLRALGCGSHAAEAARESLRVKEVMTTDVVTTTPDATLADGARLMRDKRIGCLPVVADGRLVGVLTESDFVDLALKKDEKEA
jgi:CBS domain-containing protein